MMPVLCRILFHLFKFMNLNLQMIFSAAEQGDSRQSWICSQWSRRYSKETATEQQAEAESERPPAQEARRTAHRPSHQGTPTV